MKAIAVYGAGGFGREVEWLARVCHPQVPIVAFVDDGATGASDVHGIPVVSLAELAASTSEAAVALAIGSPAARAGALERVEEAGLTPLTLVHPDVQRSSHVKIGLGSVLCAGAILTTEVTLGLGIQINLRCTIGHDVHLGDFATLAPGVHVSGCVHVGKRAYIGTGAVLINGTPSRPLVVGDDAVVGAGACVVRDVPAGATVVGVPAKEIRP